MSGKSIVVAVSRVGWLMASLAAFVVVALVGFFGIGLIGLAIVFVSTQGNRWQPSRYASSSISELDLR